MSDPSDGLLRRRLLRGFGATALGPVVTTAVQLGTVPILLSVWGTARYADWLLLSAVPSYLALSDFGFGDAAATDMSVRAAAGDRAGAVETLQSSWLLLTASSVTFALLAALAVFYTPWQQWLNLSSVAAGEARAVLLALIAYVAIGQQMRLLEGGFRCDGRYAEGAFWANVARLVEAVAATAAAAVWRSLVAAALAYAAMRAILVLAYGCLLRHRSPWLEFGWARASAGAMWRQAGPALAFLVLPAGQAISLQGSTLLIGAALGPTAVVAWTTLRTLTRVNFQILTVVARTLWPELSAAFGASNIGLARILHRRACQVAFASTFSAGALLWLTGPSLYRAWMSTAVEFDAACFHALLLAVSAQSLWYVSSIVPMSTNTHQPVAWLQLAGSAAALAAGSVLLRPLDITGMALAMLVVEVLLCCFVVRAALRQVDDTLAGFLSSLGTRPSLAVAGGRTA